MGKKPKTATQQRVRVIFPYGANMSHAHAITRAEPEVIEVDATEQPQQAEPQIRQSSNGTWKWIAGIAVGVAISSIAYSAVGFFAFERDAIKRPEFSEERNTRIAEDQRIEARIGIVMEKLSGSLDDIRKGMNTFLLESAADRASMRTQLESIRSQLSQAGLKPVDRLAP